MFVEFRLILISQFYAGMKPAFNGIPNAEQKPYSDQWGSQLSGYAPIKNSQGEIVGIACVDVDAGIIADRNRQIRWLVALFVAVSILIGLALSVHNANRIQEPIKLLNQNMIELAQAGADLTRPIKICNWWKDLKYRYYTNSKSILASFTLTFTSITLTISPIANLRPLCLPTRV